MHIIGTFFILLFLVRDYFTTAKRFDNLLIFRMYIPDLKFEIFIFVPSQTSPAQISLLLASNICAFPEIPEIVIDSDAGFGDNDIELFEFKSISVELQTVY